MTRKAKPVPMGVGTGSGNKGKAGSAPYSPPKHHRKPPGTAIASIKLGHRHRRDLGDVAALAASMDDIGLLQPVVLRRDRTLIAGARRIAAATKLGWKTIPATVIDLDDILRGEFAENAYRKNLTLSEAVAIADALEALERKAAKARQAAAGPASGRGKKATASVNFTKPVRGQALDKVAKALGMSRPTLQRARAIVTMAQADPAFADLQKATQGSGPSQFAVIQAAAPSLRVEVSPVNMREGSEIERAVTAFARSPGGGLIVTAGPAATRDRNLIVKLAARHRLPAVYYERLFVAGGGLISYGPDFVDQYRRAAGYVDRILKGEKPADLPVQAPTKYELVINLKTAKALGLTVPPSLLATASEVIE